jgi:hypothetical protein
MPERLRTVIGILLILAASGVASWQSLLVACSPPTAAGSEHDPVVAPG